MTMSYTALLYSLQSLRGAPGVTVVAPTHADVRYRDGLSRRGAIAPLADLYVPVAPSGASVSTRTHPSAPPASLSRVCVIASGAAVGNAVRRNRAKRRLRELFRHNQSAVPAGVDLLLIARAAVTDCPLPDLTRRFHEACRSIDTANAPRA